MKFFFIEDIIVTIIEEEKSDQYITRGQSCNFVFSVGFFKINHSETDAGLVSWDAPALIPGFGSDIYAQTYLVQG